MIILQRPITEVKEVRVSQYFSLEQKTTKPVNINLQWSNRLCVCFSSLGDNPGSSLSSLSSKSSCTAHALSFFIRSLRVTGASDEDWTPGRNEVIAAEELFC
ncbi:hypothetical protein CDAR_516701 [Caerostris darwini]|uniref:Uncharacterized protein n=1 Tax=Caerostris darwini TaxID=1538125 RepID=A0AAV4WSZ5_9ARAC|nr:hypothetical protein CDAR_516701 [Caerostris darwini]